MIFNIINHIIDTRRFKLSNGGEEFGPLKLRMIAATWCDAETSQYVNVASKWRSIRSIVTKHKLKASKLDITLEISSSLASGHDSVLRKCFKTYSLLPDDVEPIVFDEAWFSNRDD